MIILVIVIILVILIIISSSSAAAAAAVLRLVAVLDGKWEFRFGRRRWRRTARSQGEKMMVERRARVRASNQSRYYAVCTC